MSVAVPPPITVARMYKGVLKDPLLLYSHIIGTGSGNSTPRTAPFVVQFWIGLDWPPATISQDPLTLSLSMDSTYPPT